MTLAVGAAMAAQAQMPGSNRCDTTAPDSLSGVIRGIVVNDSGAMPVGWATVFTGETNCRLLTHADGRFEFRGVRAGAYAVEAAKMGHRRFTPVAVVVKPLDTVFVELRLQTENRVTDCLAIAACALMLNREPDPALSDSARLRESALRTSIAMHLTYGWQIGEFVACFDDPDPEVRAEIAAAVQKVAAAADCHFPPTGSETPSATLVHRPTGDKAALFTVKLTSLVDDLATATVSNGWGRRLGIWWSCDFRRERRTWTATACRMIGIS